MKNLLLISGSLLLMTIFLMFSFEGCAQKDKSDNAAEIAQIEKTIDGCIEWAKTKDFNWLYSIIANDTSYLEVHPEDFVVKGFANFKRMEKFWSSPDFKSIRHDIRDLRITLSRSGDVAWFFCMVDDINEWKGESVSWINTRWTGVLEKREGKWVIVQMHFSNPVS
jgi:ketosteroid isomerase-like protein